MPVVPEPSTVSSSLCWHAVPVDALIVEPLDALTAVFHRASGITHLLGEPAPEILAALADQPLTVAQLLDRLRRSYDVVDAGALAERLDELTAAGLIEAAAAP